MNNRAPVGKDVTTATVDIIDEEHSATIPVNHRGHNFSGNDIAGHAQAHFGDVVNHNYYGAALETYRAERDEQEKYESLRRSLEFDRIDARIRNIATALPKTCEWLFSHPDFLSWSDDSKAVIHHGFLWIKGKPGSGKSTIMKKALAWVQKQWPDRVTVSYFFNARAHDSLEKSPFGMYRSLVHQILCAIPKTKELFLKHFSSKVSGKEKGFAVEPWTEGELQDFLVGLVTTANTPPLKIFIDALDEGNEDDVRQMIAFLEDIGEHGNSSMKELRICLSSRHFPHIRIKKGLSLVVEHQEEQKEDIREYIQKKLDGIESNQTDNIRELICEKSRGVFLWVVLVVQQLNKLYDRGYDNTAIMKCLDGIPEGLDSLFMDISTRDSDDQEEFVTLLQWVLFAQRPLTATELYTASCFSSAPPSGSLKLASDETYLSKYVLNFSRGLVEVTAKKAYVQFIHETVREFLIGKCRLAQIDSSLVSTIQGLSHDKCKVACLHYIKCCPEPDSDRCSDPSLMKKQNKYPLLKYASKYLLNHAETAGANEVSQESFLDELSENKNNLFKKVMFYYENPSSVKELLYVLAERDSVSLIKSYHWGSSTINEIGGEYGTALQVASLKGHQTIAQFLLENGACVEVECTCSIGTVSHEAPLLMASKCGQRDMVKLLLRHGSNVNAWSQRPLYGTALQAAAGEGYSEVAETLIASGADVNAQIKDTHHGTALQAAVAGSCRSSVEILLRHGADINIQNEGTYHGTALQAAAAVGNWEIVELLLKQGADVNATVKESCFGTALHAAASKGYCEIEEILLEYGADMSIRNQGINGSTALEEAAKHGHWEAVEVLLEQSADVDEDGTQYGPALQLASRRGHTTVVEVLLRYGVDVNGTGGPYGSALQAALGLGTGVQRGIIDYLLEHGAIFSDDSQRNISKRISRTLRHHLSKVNNSDNHHSGADEGNEDGKHDLYNEDDEKHDLNEDSEKDSQPIEVNVQKCTSQREDTFTETLSESDSCTSLVVECGSNQNSSPSSPATIEPAFNESSLSSSSSA